MRDETRPKAGLRGTPQRKRCAAGIDALVDFLQMAEAEIPAATVPKKDHDVMHAAIQTIDKRRGLIAYRPADATYANGIAQAAVGIPCGAELIRCARGKPSGTENRNAATLGAGFVRPEGLKQISPGQSVAATPQSAALPLSFQFDNLGKQLVQQLEIFTGVFRSESPFQFRSGCRVETQFNFSVFRNDWFPVGPVRCQ